MCYAAYFNVPGKVCDNRKHYAFLIFFHFDFQGKKFIVLFKKNSLVMKLVFKLFVPPLALVHFHAIINYKQFLLDI